MEREEEKNIPPEKRTQTEEHAEGIETKEGFLGKRRVGSALHHGGAAERGSSIKH
jgi:hypothetical protein